MVIVKAEGGREIRRDIALANKSDSALKFTIQPEYWVRPAGLPELAGWMDIRPGIVEIPANGRRKVSLRFKLPEVLQGECLVMVFFAKDPANADIKILPRVGIPLYICRQKSEVFQAAIQIFAARTEKTFELKIKNTGNVHVIPFGNVQVKNQAGKLVYLKEFRFPEPVFSGQVGSIEISGNPLPEGAYRAEAVAYLDTLYAMPAGARQKLSAACQFVYP